MPRPKAARTAERRSRSDSYRGCSCQATTEIGSAVLSWLCRDRSGDRVGRPVDVFVRRRPVRNRHPQHVSTVPGGPAEPTGSVPLDRGHRGPVGIVAAGQPHQHLVEHHVVEIVAPGILPTAWPFVAPARSCVRSFRRRPCGPVTASPRKSGRRAPGASSRARSSCCRAGLDRPRGRARPSSSRRGERPGRRRSPLRRRRAR